MIAGISASRIDEWVRGLGVGAVTRNTFRRRLAVLFSFAKRRGYVTENPIADVERAKERETEIEILSVSQVARLLESASSDMLPFWAIGAFAGLRRAEIERLTWSEVDFDAGVIEVKASKSKTATRRLVTIQPNLREWLAPYRTRIGRVCPVNLQRKINEDRERAGLRAGWPQNALAAQLRLLSSCAVQRCGKAGARNGQLTSNNLPPLSATREAEAGRALLEDRPGRGGQESHSVRGHSGVTCHTIRPGGGDEPMRHGAVRKCCPKRRSAHP